MLFLTIFSVILVFSGNVKCNDDIDVSDAVPIHHMTHEAYEKCPKGATGQFPYSLSCCQFLNCWKGLGGPQDCAPGTLFNPKTLKCDYPHNVKCNTVKPEEIYYWREFCGTVPRDAVSAGAKGENHTYIVQGQSLSSDKYNLTVAGEFPTYWFSDWTEVTLPIHSHQKVSTFKILCAPLIHHRYFQWVPTHSSTIGIDCADKHLILGGQEKYDDGRDYKLHITRNKLGVDTVIGKYIENPEDNSCYFIDPYDSALIHRRPSFEVLTYDERCTA